MMKTNKLPKGSKNENSTKEAMIKKPGFLVFNPSKFICIGHSNTKLCKE